MIILSLNVNDFGGNDEHREVYRKIYGNYTYLKKWDALDKSKNVDGIYECIEELYPKPHIIILQEFDINSFEAIFFNKKLERLGYVLKSEAPSQRPSMTVFFISNSLENTSITSIHERALRAYAIEVNENGYIVYGTHVPPIYDKSFWNEIRIFAQKYGNRKLVLCGDFNTIQKDNKKELNSILDDGFIDVWASKGNKQGISVPGDYVLVSNSVKTDDIYIQSKPIDFSDHPIVLVSLP